jgi:dihydropteroate synthase
MLLWQTSRYAIDLSVPRVMGIVNLTPDSFSDGGRFAQVDAALAQAQRLIDEGAHVLDLGAESTRPGAQAVGEVQEWARLEPVLRALLDCGVPLSIDTYKPAVMQRALDVGADIINDVWGLRWHAPDQPVHTGLNVVAAHPNCGVCVMHMHGDPTTMQVQPMVGDALASVVAFLRERRQALLDAGVAPERIALDPGVGFGKTVAQNFSLLERNASLLALGSPVLAGWSRKSSLGAVTGRDVHERGVASAAAAMLAVDRGARVVRVHDVAATVDALAVWSAAVAQREAVG